MSSPPAGAPTSEHPSRPVEQTDAGAVPQGVAPSPKAVALVLLPALVLRLAFIAQIEGRVRAAGSEFVLAWRLNTSCDSWAGAERSR
jgi:hypothetical protein